MRKINLTAMTVIVVMTATLGLTQSAEARPGGLPARVAELEKLVGHLLRTIGDLEATIA